MRTSLPHSLLAGCFGLLFAVSAAAGEDPYGLAPSNGSLFARWNSQHDDAYELDEIERFVEDRRTRVECDPSGLVQYAGTSIRYAGSVRVNPSFQVRLARFEALVVVVSQKVYGRAPRRVLHYGSYSCRRSRGRAYRLSEHALGNAIDIVGFDFGSAKKSGVSPDLPRYLRGPFQVRVARHWSGARTEAARAHERFLKELLSQLAERRDVFRILIGPGHGNHADHFHFDMSPWRYVDL